MTKTVRTDKLKQIPDRKIRLFLAIDLPLEVKRILYRQLSSRLDDAAVKKVPQQNLHITLQFIGLTGERALPTLIRKIEQMLFGQEQISVIIGENGCFPNTEKAHILWVGVSGDIARVTALANRLRAIVPNQIDEFVPHITIASVKDRLPRWQRQEIVKQFLAKKLKKPVWFPVTEVVLFQSKLTKSHPIYTKLATFPLQ